MALLDGARAGAAARCGGLRHRYRPERRDRHRYDGEDDFGKPLADRSVGSRRPSRPAAPFVACDQNIRAKAGTTTCPFALNAFWAYWNSGRSTSISVYSPKAGRSLETRCRSGVAQVICRTSDGGVVKFPKRAVDAYTQDMADAYAAKADLGPDGSSRPSQGVAPESLPEDDASSGSSGCSPEYSGCVPADAGDVDCTELAETDIDVYGSDPYGLDADGDGVGCES